MWGYPLVSNLNRFERASTVESLVIIDDTMPRSPINQICFLTHHARPDERAIVAPNVDTKLAYGADASLDPILQHCEPTARAPTAGEASPNWLPVPEGSFELTLRVYKPGGPSDHDPPRVVRVH